MGSENKGLLQNTEPGFRSCRNNFKVVVHPKFAYQIKKDLVHCLPPVNYSHFYTIVILDLKTVSSKSFVQ